MGRVGQGETVTSFIGVSEAVDTRGESEGGLDVAKLNEALASAAQQAIDAGLVASDKTAWVRITFIDVELANQHPRTVRVGVSVI
jgi:hypothetical protein